MTQVYEIASNWSEEMAEADEFICGTEYEIEDILKLYYKDSEGNRLPLSRSSLNDSEPAWFGDLGYMIDGSLRNNGVEIVTAPVNYDAALGLFKYVHEKAVELGPNPYTARTSIHVHVNVLPWTLEKLYHFTLLYALLEPVFFAYTPSRKSNIHCVPLNYTTLPNVYSLGINTLLNKWSKYSAFNLLPVTKQGTVEFRHLHGTGDFSTYRQWLTIIRNLWNFVDKSDTDWLYGMLKAGMPTRTIAGNVLGETNIPPGVDFSVSTVDVKLAFV